ncbi:hypothetical protein PMIN01_09710 [Paraphaeosphaeria minitans]|uniref:Uncharacterized protein n=1 Tax=Paraphaeosphaeria minitans TaxID=565426 RepID=A0A9P6G9S3_9PLEO|nr:hypothetical protein PMIN01_09710 [Paraphaeosphaeria minitans]
MPCIGMSRLVANGEEDGGGDDDGRNTYTFISLGKSNARIIPSKPDRVQRWQWQWQRAQRCGSRRRAVRLDCNGQRATGNGQRADGRHMADQLYPAGRGQRALPRALGGGRWAMNGVEGMIQWVGTAGRQVGRTQRYAARRLDARLDEGTTVALHRRESRRRGPVSGSEGRAGLGVRTGCLGVWIGCADWVSGCVDWVSGWADGLGVANSSVLHLPARLEGRRGLVVYGLPSLEGRRGLVAYLPSLSGGQARAGRLRSTQSGGQARAAPGALVLPWTLHGTASGVTVRPVSKEKYPAPGHTYLPTHPPTYLPTDLVYLPTDRPTYLPTYLLSTAQHPSQHALHFTSPRPPFDAFAEQSARPRYHSLTRYSLRRPTSSATTLPQRPHPRKLPCPAQDTTIENETATVATAPPPPPIAAAIARCSNCSLRDGIIRPSLRAIPTV